MFFKRNCCCRLSSEHKLFTQIAFMLMLALPLLFASVIAHSETLVIPDIANQPGGAPDTTPRPARAMSMDQVRDQFGPPQQVMGPVGDPPITRWVYDKFVVTFESEYVIHSVAKRR